MNGLASPVAHGKTLRFSGFLIAAALLVPAQASAGVNVWTGRGLEGRAIGSLVIDPGDRFQLYAAAGWNTGQTDGLWKSSDRGMSWIPTSIGLPGLTVWALAADENRLGTFYTVNGNPSYYLNGKPMGPLEIHKSTDSAATWLALGRKANSLAVTRGTSTRLYAGADGAVLSSDDGGRTWIGSQVPHPRPNDCPFCGAESIISLAISPSDPSTIYAGSDADMDYPETSIFRSTDAGATWVASDRGLPSLSAFSFAIDPGDSARVLAATSKGTWFSADGGGIWSQTLGANTRALAVDPTNAAIIYAGTDGAGVQVSRDRGLHWASFNAGLSNLHVLSLAIDYTGRRLYAGTRGGVFAYEIFSPGSACGPEGQELCLLGNRFQVALQAADPRSGRTGIGRAIQQSDRFGYFSLPSFTGDPAFPEVFVKMVDATSAPSPFGGSFWVFYSGLTDLQYTMTVTDTVTGEVKSYRNDPAYPMCGGADTSAFKNIDASVQQLTVGNAGPATSLAAAEGIELALLGNRFRVALSAVDPRTGDTAVGQAMPQGDRFGYFSLPDFTGDPAFPEVFVKMVDATSMPGGSFWVFHTGLTDLQYTMTMTDTVTGAVRIYQNDRSDPARLCGGSDTAAFSN